MRLIRSPWTQAFLVWTIVFAIAAILLAGVAVIGMLRADDACFFGVGPCPDAGDVNHVRLAVAVFVIPLIWLVGVLIGAVARALTRRRRATPR